MRIIEAPKIQMPTAVNFVQHCQDNNHYNYINFFCQAMYYDKNVKNV